MDRDIEFRKVESQAGGYLVDSSDPKETVIGCYNDETEDPGYEWIRICELCKYSLDPNDCNMCGRKMKPY